MKSLRLAALPLLLTAASAAQAQTADIAVNDGTTGKCYGVAGSTDCSYFSAPTIDTLVDDGAGKFSEVTTTADATSITTTNGSTWSGLNVASGGTALESEAASGYAAAATQTGTSSLTGLESGQFLATGENTSGQDSSIALEGTAGFIRTRDTSTGTLSFYETSLTGTTMGYVENGTPVATISSNVDGHQIVGNTALAGTLSVTGASTLNGIDNQGAGIANAGVVGGVTAGTIAADSSEAVNGSQLFETNTAVAAAQTAADTAMTNAATAQATADIAAADATVAKGTAADARALAQTAQTNATTALTNSANAWNVANTANANALSAYSMASGLSGRISSLEGRVDELRADLEHVDRTAGRGIAIATALASMPDLEPGKRMGIGIGAGSYDGHNAVSAAFILRATENAKFRVNGGTAGDGKFAFGAGGMFSW